VETNHKNKVTILWHQKANTARTIPNKKPNIMICDNDQETCLLMDMEIAENRNTIKKEV